VLPLAVRVIGIAPPADLQRGPEILSRQTAKIIYKYCRDVRDAFREERAQCVVTIKRVYPAYGPNHDRYAKRVERHDTSSVYERTIPAALDSNFSQPDRALGRTQFSDHDVLARADQFWLVPTYTGINRG
jgi:hypothetical protein